MTERVTSGIIRSKRIGLVWAGLVAAALALSWGCAQKGTPAGPDGVGGYRVVGSLAIVGYAEDVEVAGGVCLIAASQGGLVVVDVSDPGSPSLLGSGATQYEATGCAYVPSDSLAFVTVGTPGVAAFDVTDPTTPVFQSNGQGIFARGVVSREDVPGESHYVFSADGGGILVQRCYYSAVLETWYFSQLAHVGSSGKARGIWLTGDTALLAMEELGLRIYDVSTPGGTFELGAVDTPGEARAVASDGQYAYVADWRAGLQVVDIGDPSAPVIVASADTEGNADGIWYESGRVYVAAHSGGLRVFDVTDPTAPELVGHLDTPYANDVFVAGPLVYVADRDLGLVIAEEE